MNDPHFTRSAQLLRSFWNVNKNIMRLIQTTASENGLSVPQYTILLTISQHREIVQKTVGELTFLPKSTLSQAVDGLVNLELITRKQVEGNRRETLLSITEKGFELIKKLHLHEGGIHQVFQLAIESLTEEQFNDLLNAHSKITENLEKNELT